MPDLFMYTEIIKLREAGAYTPEVLGVQRTPAISQAHALIYI